MPSLRDALEAALVEDPDDLATHRAYADYLQEQGDPRGEFIQVQLTLEDPERTAEERRELERRERELLAEHEREWLGGLADELLGPEGELGEEDHRHYEIRFARGWLDRITLRYPPLLDRGGDVGKLLVKATEMRLLRELVLEYDEGMVEQFICSPFLGNVRVFQLGMRKNFFRGDLLLQPRMWSWAGSDSVAKLPRIEELYLFMRTYDAVGLFALSNLQNLRVLQVDQMVTPYPLGVLADNPALSNLTHLLLYPGVTQRPLIDLAGIRAVIQSPYLQSLTHLQLRRSDLGDVGCTEIVTSGILKRLKALDLRRGEITDAGARILADCPDLQRLEHLDIDRNGLTQAGIDALRRVLGDRLRADYQQTAEELAQRRYLYEGDWE
ncbi:MAG TPA: TIGR02996 domain-containing protein [Gemmataceae bacterium]